MRGATTLRRVVRWTLQFATLLALLAVMTPGSASAQDGLPRTYAQRPVVLPRGTLVAYGGARYRIDAVASSRRPPGYVHLGAGASVVDDLEFGVTALSLSLGDKTEPFNPTLYARYRFVNHEGFEVSAEVGTLPGGLRPAQSKEVHR